MTMKTTLTCATALLLAFAASAPALAQDNPLLAPAETNPLLMENTGEPTFEQQARAIDAAATKSAGDPVCQNIRTNYDQSMDKIMRDAGQSGGGLSQLGSMSSTTNGTLSRLNRMNRNITGDYSNGLSRTLGDAGGFVNRGSSVVGDAVALGGLLGIKGKSKEEKAAEKMAELDAQAMDAVRQMGCPMATFN